MFFIGMIVGGFIGASFMCFAFVAGMEDRNGYQPSQENTTPPNPPRGGSSAQRPTDKRG